MYISVFGSALKVSMQLRTVLEIEKKIVQEFPQTIRLEES
jgi:hypothetical protein